MKLLGLQETNPQPGDHGLIAAAFEKIPQQCHRPGELARLVGYQCAEREAPLRFIGIVADDTMPIPAGWVAWEFEGGSWIVRGGGVPNASADWQGHVDWHWRVELDAPSGGWLGEFSSVGLPVPPDERTERSHRVELFAHAPLSLGGESPPDDVVLVDHDPRWPAAFHDMARWLERQLGPDIARRIEHYGSTAIPGMPAKPIVDILVEIPSFEVAKPRALACMVDPTWESWCYADHIICIKRSRPLGERTHHVHLAPAGHAIWQGLVFRDHLRRDAEAAGQYAAMKRRLACDHRADREAYTAAKTDFVRTVTARAGTEAGA